MKRIIVLYALLLLFGILFTFTACKGSETSTSPVESQVPLPEDTLPKDTLPEDALPADGVFSAVRSDGTVTLTVTLSDEAGKEVSFLLLEDLAYRNTWAEDPDARLINMGQITLDEQGRGTITLSCGNDSTRFFAVMTAGSGCFIAEVK